MLIYTKFTGIFNVFPKVNIGMAIAVSNIVEWSVRSQLLYLQMSHSSSSVI